ncbi:hypothetical protein PAMP_002046 [Pampus punctatissimus]
MLRNERNELHQAIPTSDRPILISPRNDKYKDTDSPYQPNNILALPDTTTEPAANRQLCPSQLPATQSEEQTPQVVLLADSNEKFLITNKFFPGF